MKTRRLAAVLAVVGSLLFVSALLAIWRWSVRSRPEGLGSFDPLSALTEIDLERLRAGKASTKDMVFIPGGPFVMGDDEGNIDERPHLKVFLDAFYIDRTEVTNEQYQRFVEATGHRIPRPSLLEHQPYAWANGRHPDGLGAHPVVLVTWEDALSYALWCGKRLPTEAEWEKAARGAEGRKWPWGAEWDTARCNSLESGAKGTIPVGSIPAGASPYNCFDMAGNVMEWCLDLYERDYYSRSPSRNPQGPEAGVACVVRGGSWADRPFNLRGSNRSRATPTHRLATIGFRCALSVPSEASP